MIYVDIYDIIDESLLILKRERIMKNRFLIICIIASLFITSQLDSVSVVYNLRFSEVSRTRTSNSTGANPSTLGLVLFDQTRTRTGNTIQDNIAGSMATYLYTRENFYCRADLAFANVRSKSKTSYFSRTQTDDFLLTIGYGKEISKRTRVTASLLLGFPTHADKILEGITFGTGHNGFGLQLDGLFIPSENGKQSIFAAARYIRFFPGSVFSTIQNRCLHFELDIGNLVDLMIGYNYRYKTNMFELGYNPSFLFSATITPETPTVISQLDYIRSNFYGAYKRFFLREKHPQAFIIAMSYGFDNKPKVFKRIVTIWAVWGITF